MIFQKHQNHGKHIAYSEQEAKRNEANGWITVSKEEFYEIDLRVQYEKKFGKEPHHLMKEETIRAKLEE
jgi:hypothetical protein